MEKTLELCKNDLVSFLKKSPKDFTLSDIIRYVREQGIEMVNFMYPAADGRLKTLNFVINDLAYLESILTKGERVDGSSLFPYISAGSSDLYVVPRLRTAFRDPFALQPTLTMLLFRPHGASARKFAGIYTAKSLLGIHQEDRAEIRGHGRA